jgi:hypothetical protein
MFRLLVEVVVLAVTGAPLALLTGRLALAVAR